MSPVPSQEIGHRCGLSCPSAIQLLILLLSPAPSASTTALKGPTERPCSPFCRVTCDMSYQNSPGLVPCSSSALTWKRPQQVPGRMYRLEYKVERAHALTWRSSRGVAGLSSGNHLECRCQTTHPQKIAWLNEIEGRWSSPPPTDCNMWPCRNEMFCQPGRVSPLAMPPICCGLIGLLYIIYDSHGLLC